jgi:hypothetical protein
MNASGFMLPKRSAQLQGIANVERRPFLLDRSPAHRKIDEVIIGHAGLSVRLIPVISAICGTHASEWAECVTQRRRHAETRRCSRAITGAIREPSQFAWSTGNE